jgi:prevent-host-death family protein
MRSVTLTELRRNLDGYLNQAQTGDIVITKYGREIGRLIAAAGAANVAGNAESGNATSEREESDTASAA